MVAPLWVNRDYLTTSLSIWVPPDVFCHVQKRDYLSRASQRRKKVESLVKLAFHGADTDTDTDISDAPIM